MGDADKLNTDLIKAQCVLCSIEEGDVKNGQKVLLHQIPKVEEKKYAWEEKITEWKPGTVVTDDTRLCNFHFDENICDINSIPTKFNTEESETVIEGDVLEKIADSLKSSPPSEDLEQPSCSKSSGSKHQTEEKPEPRLSLKEQLAQLPVCPSLSKEPVNVSLCSINTYITCALCGGYLYEASTITECMHTFCKTCIVRHLEKSLNCPTCDTEIHPTDPIVNIRHDSTIQDIVYRLLPDVAEEEQRREKEFYEEHERKTGERILPKLTLPPPPPSTPPANEHDPFSFPIQRKKKSHSRGPRQIRREIKRYFNTNFVSLQLEYEGEDDLEESPLLQVDLDKPFLRVTSKATVGNIATFIRKKLQLERCYHVDIYHTNHTEYSLLSPENSLEKVREQFHEGEDVIMEFRYRITEIL